MECLSKHYIYFRDIDRTQLTMNEKGFQGDSHNFVYILKVFGAISLLSSQGLCGACWAFTTTGVMEGALFLSTGKLVNLSQQQLIDCDKKVFFALMSI